MGSHLADVASGRGELAAWPAPLLVIAARQRKAEHRDRRPAARTPQSGYARPEIVTVDFPKIAVTERSPAGKNVRSGHQICAAE